MPVSESSYGEVFSDLMLAARRLNGASQTLDMYDTREDLPPADQIADALKDAEEAVGLLRKHADAS